MIIAIDGPSGAGKGTVATYLAIKFNLHKLDTGLLYRALALKIIDLGISLSNQEDIITQTHKITLEDTLLPGLKKETVANIASQVGAIPEVREIMDKIQRDFAYGSHEGFDGVILDGRDIGTVICPDADIKIFLTANEDVRAQRRAIEETSSTTTISKMMQERDQRDSTRQKSPLNAAKDAFIIDTSHLTIDEVCQKAAYYIEKYIK